MRLLCLTNAIRRFQVKSLSTGSPTLYFLWPEGLIGHTSAETFPGFRQEKCSKKIVFPGIDTFHLHEHEKDKYYVYNNDQQRWLMNASHYGMRPSHFLIFDDIIFVFLLFLYCRSHSSSYRCSCSLSVRQNVSNRPTTAKRISWEQFVRIKYNICIIAIVIYICGFWSRPENGGGFSFSQHDKNMTNRFVLRSSVDFKCSQHINYSRKKIAVCFLVIILESF